MLFCFGFFLITNEVKIHAQVKPPHPGRVLDMRRYGFLFYSSILVFVCVCSCVEFRRRISTAQIIQHVRACQSADVAFPQKRGRFGREDKNGGDGGSRGASVRLCHTRRVLWGFPQRRSPAKFNSRPHLPPSPPRRPSFLCQLLQSSRFRPQGVIVLQQSVALLKLHI